MREKCGFLVVAVSLLAFLVLFAPQQAAAQVLTVGTGNSPGNVPGPPPAVTPLCPQNNAIDDQARANGAAQAQALFTAAHNTGTLFPIAQSMNQCLTNVISAIQSLTTVGNVADPLNIANTIISAIVTQVANQVINQTCSAVMATIGSVQQGLTNLTKICVPLPSFGGLDLPTFASSQCSGGMSFNLLNSSSATSSTAVYNYSQYLQ